MGPPLAPDARVPVQKLVYGPERGDVIVFSDPKGRPGPEDFIKPVIGLPGETAELRDGSVFIEGARAPEADLRGAPDTRDDGPVEVPGDAPFVPGDNRTNSNDSPFGPGFIALDKVIGRAFAVVWPPSRVGWIH